MKQKWDFFRNKTVGSTKVAAIYVDITFDNGESTRKYEGYIKSCNEPSERVYECRTESYIDTWFEDTVRDLEVRKSMGD